MRIRGSRYRRGRILLRWMLWEGGTIVGLMFVMGMGDMVIKKTFEIVKGAMFRMRRLYGRMGR